MVLLPSLRPSAAAPSAAVAVLGIGRATPPSISQALAAQLAADFACQTPAQRAWLERVFLRSGLEARGCVLAPHDHPSIEALHAFYPPRRRPDDRGPTTAVRMARYAAEAPGLARRAGAAALDAAGFEARAITHLITASCTGFFAPGLDAALIRSLGLPPTVRRTHLGFMGCHAAFNALAVARAIVLPDPRAVVLVCCVELCTLHFSYGWDPGKLVASALFGDGAAAAVLGAVARPQARPPWAQRGLTLLDTASSLLPDSAAAMTWNIGDHGFEMTLAPEVPGIVAQHVPPFIDAFLSRHGLTPADIAHWAIHPGGPKVLHALAEALALPAGALDASRHILARHGNMSSATILFILQHLAATTAPGPTLAIGLGPGLMAEAMLLA